MATSPCNNLNVKTLRISQLATSTGINNNDLIAISQFDSVNNVYYSKKATCSSLITYFGTVNGSYKGSFTGSLNIQSGFTGSLTLANTAGSVTSNYLPVKINGTTYKILLYNI
jgi:hypothetical protein